MAEVARTSRKDGRLQLDAFAWLNKVTLDIIGLAGDVYSVPGLFTKFMVIGSCKGSIMTLVLSTLPMVNRTS